MSPESRRAAGIILVLVPTVVIGGVSLLSLLISPGTGYAANPLRQDLWRAGHAHAGVLLVLALVMLRYVDEARLSPGWKVVARYAAPAAAILMSLGFFLSILPPGAVTPNALIALPYVAAVVLVTGVVALGVGLLRGRAEA